MNVLSYRTSDWNGLTIELTIDGESVQEIFESDTIWIPYWLVEGKLTAMTIMDEEYHIVSVCDCGEPGCGVIACKVTKIKVIVGDENAKLVWVGLLHNTEQVVGTKRIKFQRAGLM